MSAELAATDAPGLVARVRYAVTAATGWDEARPAFERAAASAPAGPFQALGVLDAWYGAMERRPDIEPLLLTASEVRTGALALCLPLVRLRQGALRVAAFADLDLVDYNAPLLGPAAPRGTAEAAALWRALRRALPRTDVIALRKMPAEIEGRPNPLALLRTLPSPLNGNLVRLGDDYDAYLRGVLKRVVRKELERSRRVFERHPGARFLAASAPEERRRVLETIERQQPIRMQQVGRAYRLDAPEAADFYRRLAEAPGRGQAVHLTALAVGDEIVAGLMGLQNGRRLTMIRIASSADPAWTNCSPGRLVIERTMAHLHAAGLREFDFSVGNYDYKRRFGVEPTPLVELTRALTPLGLPAAASHRGRAWLRNRPALEERLRLLAARVRRTESSP